MWKSEFQQNLELSVPEKIIIIEITIEAMRQRYTCNWAQEQNGTKIHSQIQIQEKPYEKSTEIVIINLFPQHQRVVRVRAESIIQRICIACTQLILQSIHSSYATIMIETNETYSIGVVFVVPFLFCFECFFFGFVTFQLKMHTSITKEKLTVCYFCWNCFVLLYSENSTRLTLQFPSLF